MRWLFAVFLASLCALLWAAFSVARHIRRNAKAVPASDGSPAVAEVPQSGTQPEPKVKQETL
jgi:hypothetical protein